ncbi:MAG: hypothetical protein RL513_884, partial [Pseudomonadota bacterium]
MTPPASHPAMQATQTRARRIVPCAPRPMALEARFMFDGAAAGEVAPALADPIEPVATQAPEVTLFVLPATAQDPAAARPPENLPAALALAQQQVRDFIARSSAQDLFSLFNGGQAQASAQWLAAAEELSADIQEGRYSVRVELLGGTLGWAMGAFAAQGPDGNPVIYLNADWLRGETAASDVARVLVEEIGHSIDARLNPTADTAGDEGELFAVAVASDGLIDEALVNQLQQQDDDAVIRLAGQEIAVETATYTISGVYSVFVGKIGKIEYVAGKEQQDIAFDPSTWKPTVTISDGSAGQTFSGNDLSVDLTVDGVHYYGWISRTIKDQGAVRGFYFWRDADFNSLAAAQADRNADGDNNAVDNTGFILVVDRSWFEQQGYSTDTGYKVVGSSSDNVGTLVNRVIEQNSP